MSAMKTALQVFRFGLVGMSATATHVLVFAMLIEVAATAPVPANLIAWVVAFIVSFAGHFLWTFKEAREQTGYSAVTRLPRFLVVSLFGLGLNTTIVYFVERLGLHYMVSIILMVTLVPATVFVFSKFWAFSTNKMPIQPSSSLGETVEPKHMS